MANYQLLKADIDKKVYQNGKQEITGENLNSVLNEMVTTLGEGYQFAGVATTATNPGSPDAKVFYIANGKGTYTNFGGVEVTELSAIVYGDGWGVLPLGVAFGVDTETEIGALSERMKALEADGSVTTSRIADKAVTTDKIAAGAVSIDKLNTDLQAKVNDNVKTVAQNLTAEQKAQARKNIDVDYLTEDEVANLWDTTN